MDNRTLNNPSVEWIQSIDGVARAPIASGEQHLIIHSYDRFAKEYIVRRYNRHSGELQWSTYLPAGGYASPTIGDGTVFLPCGYSQICALDEATGEKLWLHELHSRNRSTPAYFEGVALIVTANRLYGFSTQGDVVKQRTYPTNMFFGKPTVSKIDRRVYLTSLQNPTGKESRAIISAIDFDSLELVWQTDIGRGIMISSDNAGTLLVDGKIIAGSKEGLSCLDSDTGAILWQVADEGIIARSAPYAHRGTVYAGTLRGDISGFDIETGEMLFIQHLDDEGIWCPPVVYDGYLWVHAGVDLFILDPLNGQVINKFAVGHGAYTAFEVAGGKLYIAAGDPPDWSYLFCIRLSNTPKLFVESVKVDYQVSETETDSDLLTVDFSIGTADGMLPQKLTVDTRIFGGAETFTPTQTRPREYRCVWNIPNFNRYGNYALPITATFDNRSVKTTLPIYLRQIQRPQIPSSFILENFNLAPQEQPYFSGPAVLQAVMKYFGREITQAEINQMGEYMDSLGVDPHHKWRSGSVRILQSSKNS